jgi:hypothetical protein
MRRARKRLKVRPLNATEVGKREKKRKAIKKSLKELYFTNVCTLQLQPSKSSRSPEPRKHNAPPCHNIFVHMNQKGGRWRG